MVEQIAETPRARDARLVRQAEYYQRHRDKIRTKTAARRRNYKAQVLKHYGGVCACCKEANIAFLTMDHIDGGGAEHRKQGGRNIYVWLVNHNFPEGFQILCANCNHAKHFSGGCPHQEGS